MRIDWSLATANGFNFGGKESSYKLRIEEAEDGLSGAVELLKAVKRTKAPDGVQEQVAEISQELLVSLDKLRSLRTNLKSMT